ncbi:odorant receptor 85b-like [Cochliomyia hominivorax]
MLGFEKPIGLINFKHFVKTAYVFYSFAGIKLFKWDENDVMTSKEILVFCVVMTNLILNFICKCCFVIFDEFVSTVQMTQWTLYMGFALNGFCKMVSVAMGRNTLRKVLNELEYLFPKTPKHRRDFKVVEGYNFFIYHLRIMVYSHWSIVMMFICFPVVQSGVEYLKTKVYVLRTPYIMTYPFEVTYDWTYFLVYVTQILGGFTVSYYFTACDTLLIPAIYVVILQFRYLCLRIKNFKSQNYEEDMKELKDILEKHYLLNDYAERVNNVFSLSILLNYMISILVIVLIGIQIITGSDYLDLVKFGGFFTSATIQVYYVCMFSTLLMESSASVGDSLMSQEWYNADVRYQRMLTLAIARSQRPAHLTAFKFFTISMESFSNLMTTAYQFFTLLKTRMEEEGF